MNKNGQPIEIIGNFMELELTLIFECELFVCLECTTVRV